MPETPLVATITGTDDWLRSHLIRRLSTAGISAKDGGRGSSVLNGTDVLVILPALFPLRASPSRDAGVDAAGISLGAVVADNVSRVVLLSRVGASSDGGRYLSELAVVERKATAASPRTTIVRVTHPFGDPNDPGPLTSMLMNDRQPWQGTDPSVQPVSASNVVDVLEGDRRRTASSPPIPMQLRALTDVWPEKDL